jgi:Leucine-rich repeat (LRR) protein
LISDLSLLSGLTGLEELNLSENRIELIDPLSNLTNLKRLYLSDNLIKDISSLLDFEKLEYVDLAGNNISKDQISQLIDSGVDVNI